VSISLEGTCAGAPAARRIAEAREIVVSVRFIFPPILSAQHTSIRVPKEKAESVYCRDEKGSFGETPVALISLCGLALTLVAQSVYPTGTTIYDPARAWNGYTVLSPLNTQAAIVIDMNGNIVKQWEGYVNSAGGPAEYFQMASSWRRMEQTLRGRKLSSSSSVTLTARFYGASITTNKFNRVAAPSGRHASTMTGSGRIFQRATTRRASGLGLTAATH
jgi:hypothetical protein